MTDYFNPFEYEAANKFSEDQILDFYIEDFNYSRFIRSRRNIFLVGERGTGKTMTLLFNCFPVQKKKAEKDHRDLSFDIICVYIPCNTPLTHKREYQLLGDFQASVISEHFLVLATMYGIADTLSKCQGLIEDANENTLRLEAEFTLGIELPANQPFLEGLKQAFQREVATAQQAINAKTSDAFYEAAISFSAGVLPLLTCLRKIPTLQQSHFALMLDDAHDLNIYQVKSLNSWIAYRDNSLFSFKIATAKVNRPTLVTASGGTILEGHDFTLVDMEQPYQNQYSDFGKMAREIVWRRLKKIEVSKSPDEFFPAHPQFIKDIEACKETARERAEEKFSRREQKKITDYVYKYHRAEYFRQRPPKASLPPYSGFDMLVHLSTGVIRNLLEPCYWMYERVFSEQSSGAVQLPRIEVIPPSVQSQIILDRSTRKWDWIREGLDNSVEGCSREQADQLFRLFDNLAILFRELEP